MKKLIIFLLISFLPTVVLAQDKKDPCQEMMILHMKETSEIMVSFDTEGKDFEKKVEEFEGYMMQNGQLIMECLQANTGFEEQRQAFQKSYMERVQKIMENEEVKKKIEEWQAKNPPPTDRQDMESFKKYMIKFNVFQSKLLKEAGFEF